MLLRGTKVLARCLPDGALDARSGRVEVRYQPQGKAYSAGARNLTPTPDSRILPDAHCAPSEPAAPRAKGAKGNGKAAKPTGPLPIRPSEEEILVYADGACRGNPGPAGLGVVMVWDERCRELSEFLGHGTNNIAELTAILRAAEAALPLGRPLHLYTDSSYSIGVLSKGWKAKKNIELVAEAKAALARLEEVRLFHVPGHAGVPLNERADELAVLATSSRKSTGWIDLR